MALGVALALCYLVGSFPTGFLLVKWIKRVDIRTVGSGNIGATNVGRVAGRWASVSVFLVDAAKGAVAVVLIAPGLVHAPTPAQRLGCGLAAVLGHNFPVFLKFRGGKGVATTIGVVGASMPGIACGALLVWVGCVALWRYVSVASLAAGITIPLAQIMTGRSRAETMLGIILALLIIVRHRANITRLLQGEEHRLGARHEPRARK